MPAFPKITSPCPYKGDISDILTGETCKLCKRDVTNLSAMTQEDRISFLSSCSGEVCVRYEIPLKQAALAALVAGASVTGLQTANAQDAEICSPPEPVYIIVGGIRDPHSADMQDVSEPVDLDELPIIYDDEDSADAG